MGHFGEFLVGMGFATRKSHRGGLSMKDRVKSWQALADHYLRRGKTDKAEHYQSLVRDAILNERIAAGERSVLCEQELAMLFAKKQYPIILELADQNTSNDLLLTMAVSIYLRLGNPEQASRVAARIQDYETRRLREKSIEIWMELRDPLVFEPRVHLLILTHNREKYVENALRKLADTKYENYAVYIADNGSIDSTWERALNGAKAFPQNISVRMERFPTNIGRPAGHNWLLTKYDHAHADYIAIGDDDLVDIPPDWLARMVRTAQLFPGCAAVGGKAFNPGEPDVIHAGVRNILHFDSEKLLISNNDDVLDYGQFDYVDIVDHVIGCLHIYDRELLFDKIGLFDIRFSPCQFVDIDHHLRVRLAGYPIIYNGFISFRHLREMGRKAQNDSNLQGNSFGNIHKLLRKHEQTPVMKILRQRKLERLAWLME